MEPSTGEDVNERAGDNVTFAGNETEGTTSSDENNINRPSNEDLTLNTADSNEVFTINVENEAPERSTEIEPKRSGASETERQISASKILSAPSYPAFADIIEMETVQRLSKSHIYAGDVLELVKSRDLTKFYEAQQAVELVQPTTGKSEMAHLPLPDIMNKFGLEDTEQGLSDSQVVLNRQLYGSNILDLGKKDPIWKIFLSQFKSFVIILLFIAAIASIALKNYVEGAFIIFIVTLNSIMATYMERSAANVLEKLAQLSSPTAKVIRNNVEVEIDSTEVVPGDVLLLQTGDTIVADMRMFEVMEVRINESLLTGESVDVKKTVVAEDLDSPFSTNLCFASTSVVSGFGKGIVVNTGMNTQVGKIAKQLKKASETSKVTPLQRALNRLGGTIGIISTIVLISIVIVAIFTGFDDPTRPNTNRTLSIVLLAVGFAASSIPEGLPMVVTISLSLGAKDMARENANVLKLPAVETLGCCSVVCSDKTGTLTEGKMVTTDIVIFFNVKSVTSDNLLKSIIKNTNFSLFGATAANVIAERFSFYPTFGFSPFGGVFNPCDLTDSYKRKLIQLYKKKTDFNTIDNNLLSHYSAKNKVDLQPMSKEPSLEDQSQGSGESSSQESLQAAPVTSPTTDSYLKSVMVRLNMCIGYLNSYNTKLVLDQNNKWTCVGNMTESPLVVAANKCGLKPELLDDYPRLENLEVPFNSKRKLSITVHKLMVENKFEELEFQQKGKKYTHVALVKGAPDVLRPYCKYVPSLDNGVFVDFKYTINSDEDGANSDDVVMYNNDKLSNDSLRVIMLGLVPLTDEDIAYLQSLDDSIYRQQYLLSTANFDVTTLPHNSGKIVLMGVTGSFDPPRPGVKESIDTCKSAGIRVIMITGDQKITAIAIAKQINLITPGPDTKDDELGLECNKLHINGNPGMDYLPDDQIDLITSKYSVFCRAQPEDKVAIVTSLKRKGDITAMTGDGVNDAAALKTADIGVSMGINGTDVAKGASELVLLDDNFCTIVKAVRAGRTIYSNIQKFVSFLLGTNIGEIVYLTTSIIINTLPPVEALQILFLNFLTDGCPAVALSREPPDSDAMKRPPRKPNTPIMTTEWWLAGNLPHTIFEALAVIASILIGLYLCTGVITLKDLNDRCRYVKVDDSTKMVYFCSSHEYLITPKYVGWVTNVDYFDPEERKMKCFLGAAKGRIDDLNVSNPDLHPNLRAKLENFDLSSLGGMSDFVEKDSRGWIRSNGKKDGSNYHGVGEMGYKDIVSRKSKQARTISFITAVWAEMLRAYTVRSWDYFYNVFNRNPWMHIACSISATVTFALTVFPGLSTVLHVVSLTYWQYILSILLAFTTLILDEFLSKFIYRRIKKRRALKSAE
ncbi:HAD ATPase P-type family IC family protein [Theileria parva strain Muguga]|uniref:P-type ATPase, putative n=1 Tax=Theileria parva TaxID=5875 RepID=Q4N7V0_THEPA|nr:HAD ATPase P-type family IC family protein [Theileria parva strain Muguga]EAN33958.1 HAD ATPase P-type family IC family protein [Theileria parva strain Muguga]|eukprot:XP_766241.1 P-type ATPase [Theileria parva strain Muguga]